MFRGFFFFTGLFFFFPFFFLHFRGERDPFISSPAHTNTHSYTCTVSLPSYSHTLTRITPTGTQIHVNVCEYFQIWGYLYYIEPCMFCIVGFVLNLATKKTNIKLGGFISISFVLIFNAMITTYHAPMQYPWVQHSRILHYVGQFASTRSEIALSNLVWWSIIHRVYKLLKIVIS